MKTPDPPVKTVRCPTCTQFVEWNEQQRWRPFCSERCKLIDLGNWFDESNRLPGECAATADQDSES